MHLVQHVGRFLVHAKLFLLLQGSNETPNEIDDTSTPEHENILKVESDESKAKSFIIKQIVPAAVSRRVCLVGHLLLALVLPFSEGGLRQCLQLLLRFSRKRGVVRENVDRLLNQPCIFYHTMICVMSAMFVTIRVNELGQLEVHLSNTIAGSFEEVSPT